MAADETWLLQTTPTEMNVKQSNDSNKVAQSAVIDVWGFSRLQLLSRQEIFSAVCKGSHGKQAAVSFFRFFFLSIILTCQCDPDWIFSVGADCNKLVLCVDRSVQSEGRGKVFWVEQTAVDLSSRQQTRTNVLPSFGSYRSCEWLLLNSSIWKSHCRRHTV